MRATTARKEHREPADSTAALRLRFAGRFEKFYAVDAATARRVRRAIANGLQSFLAFDTACVSTVIQCAKLVWTQVDLNPDLVMDEDETEIGEAAFDFQLKLYFDGDIASRQFEVEPDRVDISQDAGEAGAEVQRLLAMLEATGDHHEVMSFASMDAK